MDNYMFVEHSKPHCGSRQLYKGLLNDTTTMHLMQGYDYLGFINWNQRNRKIIEGKEKDFKNDNFQQKFTRDRIFLGVLMETTKYLSSGFKFWLKSNN